MAKQVNYIIEVRDRFAKNIRKFNKSFERSSKIINRVNRDLNKLAKKSIELGKKMTTRVTLPILALGTAGVFAFSKMEDGIINVFSLLEKAEIAKFGQSIKLAQKEAIALGFGIEDTNKSLFTLISASGTSEKSIKAFGIVQKLAKAGNAELGVSVSGVTAIVNAYGRETTDVSEVANTFFTGQVKGATDVARLSSAVGQVAPIAKQAGVGFKDLIATVSALTLGGLSTDESVTALRGALSALTNPGEQARKVLKALEVPFGVTQIRAAGLVKTLERLNIANKKFPDLLGKAIPNIRGLTAVTSLSADKIQILVETVDKINKDFKEGTGLNEKFTDKMKALSSEVAQTGGSLKLASAEIGKILAPVVIAAARGIRKLADGFSNLSPVTKKIIVILAAIVAVIGPLMILFGGIIISMGLMSIAATVLGISLGSVLIWLIAIPVIIAAIIAAIVFLEKRFKVFSKIGGVLKGIFGFGGRGAAASAINVDNTGEMINITEQASATNKLDVSGMIRVEAEKGTAVRKADIFNPNIGMNLAFGGL